MAVWLKTRWATKGKTAADDLTTSIAEAAKINLPAMRLRSDYSDGDIDREEDFYILKHTLCPAVLTENWFMTNEKECRWLQTEEAIESISKTHIEGIVRYIIQYKNIWFSGFYPLFTGWYSSECSWNNLSWVLFLRSLFPGTSKIP